MPRVMAAADAMASYEYTAGAKACLAWLAWQDGRPDDVITLSDEVAELMAATVGSGFYQGLIYLWPLIAVHLDAGQLAEAVAAARQLLRTARPRLTGDLESALAEAGQAWDRGQRRPGPGAAGRRRGAGPRAGLLLIEQVRLIEQARRDGGGVPGRAGRTGAWPPCARLR